MLVNYQLNASMDSQSRHLDSSRMLVLEEELKVPDELKGSDEKEDLKAQEEEKELKIPDEDEEDAVVISVSSHSHR
eukprot:CAMPEP_0170546536 /NCGR_PEP_ID=MMETSP0211-20121228/4901_1 /TAXON_ID=311385 /ORGANISM="Pseudokeronopsis sp., Strain OXSARD2" /LENGTH=75 /DNA_ID=CAMNT_0010851057 /DNA_START=400 /DNA_END=624 /DNA_ORIENTATION=+